MTFPEVYQLFDYWKRHPPEPELVELLVRVFTTWRPEGAKSEGRFLPATKISPSIGEIPSAPKPPPAATPAAGSVLHSLIKSRGGDISLADLATLGNA